MENHEKNRILVTGATGNIGTVLVEQLAAQDNIIVRVAMRSATGDTVERYRASGVEVAEMDFRQPATFPSALQDVHKVFVLTPFVPGFDDMTQTLCKAIVNAGTVRHIVKQSVIGASDQSPLDASRQHYRAEKHIEATGIPYTFIRPTAFAQQFTGIFPWIYRKGEDTFTLPIGEGKVAWIDTRDIAAIAMQSVTTPGHEGKIYNLTGPAPVCCTEIADMVSEAIGRKMTYTDMPLDAYAQRMYTHGADEYTVGQMKTIFNDMKEGWLARVSPDFEQVMGHPGTSFRDFVRDYAEVWR